MIDWLIMGTPMKFIQVGEHKDNDENTITDQCLFSSTGEFVATNKKWYTPKLRPLLSVDIRVSGLNEIQRIIVDRHRAENFRFVFGIKNHSDLRSLAKGFIEHCIDLTPSNVYGLVHRLFDIIVEQQPNEFLPLDDSREIQLKIKSHEAMATLEDIPYWQKNQAFSNFNVIFSTGFQRGHQGGTINFSPYFRSETIRKLQFDEKNLLGPYVAQLKDHSVKNKKVYGFAEVISATVTAEHLVANFPFDYLLKTKLRFLLLLGVDEVPNSWPKAFSVAADTVCFEALGHEPGMGSNQGGKVICLTTPTKQDRFNYGQRCSRYILCVCECL